MKPKISVLVAARKNSKYLAKFLAGYFLRTEDLANTEILVMLNQDDTWNDEIVALWEETGMVQFFREDHQLGRAGLHVYFNDLLKHAKGEWIIYFCEDHFIIHHGWDEKLRFDIGNRSLDPKDVNIIVPVFDNAGAMNHMVSRGFVDVLGYLGAHGWIDSYINHVAQLVFMERPNKHLVRNIDEPLFHDFTHDKPNPMSDAHMQSVSTDKAKELPKFDSEEVRQLIAADAKKIKNALGGKK